MASDAVSSSETSNVTYICMPTFVYPDENRVCLPVRRNPNAFIDVEINMKHAKMYGNHNRWDSYPEPSRSKSWAFGFDNYSRI